MMTGGAVKVGRIILMLGLKTIPGVKIGPVVKVAGAVVDGTTKAICTYTDKIMATWRLPKNSPFPPQDCKLFPAHGRLH